MNERQHSFWREWATKLAVGGVLLVLGVVSVERSVRGSSDFRGFHAIWRANTEVATQPIRQHGEEASDPDPYPPSSYVIFAPLGFLPIGVAATVWYLLNVGASWGAWRGLERLSETRLTGTWTGALLGLSIAPFWVGNLVSGQNGPILMCLVVWGYVLAWRGLPKEAGILLAIPVLMKAIPVLFFMPFVVSKKFRERDGEVAAWGAGTICVWIVVVCSLYFGPTTNLLFQQRWCSMVVRGPDGVPADPFQPKTLHSAPRYGNQSAEAVLARLLLAIPADGKPEGFRVNVQSWESATWRRVRGVFAVAVLGIGAVVLWRGGAGVSGLSQLSVATLVMLLASPIVWTHYYLWMAIPCLEALHERDRSAWSQRWLWGWWVSELCLGSAWLRAIGLHFWLVLAYFLMKFGRACAEQPDETAGGTGVGF